MSTATPKVVKSDTKSPSIWDQVTADADIMLADAEGLAAEVAIFGSRSTVLVTRTTRVTFEGVNYGLKLGIELMPEPGKVSEAIDNLFADDTDSTKPKKKKAAA